MIKEGFVLRKMPGMNLVMPTGEMVKEFKGALMLNDTGALIFEGLKNDKSVEEIVKQLVDEYTVSEEVAMSDVEKTIDSLNEAGVIE